MLADFIITVHRFRKPLAVQVKVHESTAALRSAAVRYDMRFKGRKKNHKPDHSDTLGICHRIHRDKDPVCAIVRIAPPYDGIGIVSHELTHAVIQMWLIHNNFEEVAITDENDEDFCWVLGELVRCATNELIDRGIWPDK